MSARARTTAVAPARSCGSLAVANQVAVSEIRRIIADAERTRADGSLRARSAVRSRISSVSGWVSISVGLVRRKLLDPAVPPPLFFGYRPRKDESFSGFQEMRELAGSCGLANLSREQGARPENSR